MPAATGNVIIYDTGTRGFRNSGRTGLQVDQDYDTGAGQTAFVTTQAFTATSLIDVYQNGRLLREGSGNDYTRTPGTSTITLGTSAVSAWVRVRVWT